MGSLAPREGVLRTGDGHKKSEKAAGNLEIRNIANLSLFGVKIE